jgi:hypothetical protein
MVTTFFFPSDPANKQTIEATFVLEKKITERASLFAEYVGDYPSRGSSVQFFNSGGGYLLTRTQAIDFHVARKRYVAGANESARAIAHASRKRGSWVPSISSPGRSDG